MNIKTLKSRWMGLFQTCAEAGYAGTGFNELVGRYAEPHRHYHDLHHVSGCLEAFDRIVYKLTDPFCIEAAIWFHDVVYTPKSDRNETMSAEYASAFLSHTDVARERVAEIARLIRLTRHPSDPSTEDEKYLIDIDLATLGAGRRQYERYEVMIRKEYVDVPDAIYNKERRKLLTAFLDGAHIFRTGYFRDRFEAGARANIKQALARL